MEQIDCIVIGAGVVGLAVARELTLAGREVLLLESADCIGSGVSSRNSEVIHAGIYYASGSLKARLCVAGRDALYAYCMDRGVPHRRLGKLLVATDQTQLSKLNAIGEQARRNGVDDLQTLSGADVQELEPAVTCVAGLLSPSTGIIDTHALMLAFQGDAEANGMISVFNAPVQLGYLDGDGIVIKAGGKDSMWLRARTVVNSAGLDAPTLAAQFEKFPKALVPKGFLAKGSYFSLSGVRAPFSRLIYPMPDEAGLGVHVTLDLGGRARFGPDVEWVNDRDYQVVPERALGFYAAIRRYWPGLPDGALMPDYAGIRPKIVGPGQAAADFVIQGPRIHGVPGLVNLFGIESPGITASIAIARTVLEALEIDTRKNILS